ncbi:hypothetical protein [Streptomyces sp. NPDC088141]|uniref:hypothetical protein n=1 Tax=Streptomyces sp. NPDC088141 TaxID=3155179 RepID=UPI0034333E56
MGSTGAQEDWSQIAVLEAFADDAGDVSAIATGMLVVAGCAAALGVAELNGRPCVLSGGADGTTRMWDLTTWMRDRTSGQPDHGVTLIEDGFTLALATAVVHGRPVATTITAEFGNDYGTVRLGDLSTRQQIGEPIPHGATAADVIEVAGDLVVVAGGEDRTLRLWDPMTARPVGEPLAQDIIVGERSVDTTLMDGRPAVVACGLNSAKAHVAWAWDSADRRKIGPDLAFPGPVRTTSAWAGKLAVGFGGEAVILSRE